MSDNVIGLNGNRLSVLGEPRQDIIGCLEKLLEKAKSGELQSFIGTGWTADALRMSIWCDHHEDVYQMLGSIAWLEHEYVDRHTNEG